MTTKPETPDLQICIIGEGGEIITHVCESSVLLMIRQHEHERYAEVRLVEKQIQALIDVLNQYSADPFVDDDE